MFILSGPNFVLFIQKAYSDLPLNFAGWLRFQKIHWTGVSTAFSTEHYNVKIKAMLLSLMCGKE